MLPDEVRDAKQGTAEVSGAPVRVGVVVFTALCFTVWGPATSPGWLGPALIVAAFAYAIANFALVPTRRWPLVPWVYVTAVLDSLLVVLFVGATGCSRSLYFPLFFVSIVGMAFRFSFPSTVAVSLLYGAAAGIVDHIAGQVPVDAALLVTRAGLLVFTGLEAGLLADEGARQAATSWLRLRQARAAQRRLEEANRARVQLGNTAAHELSSPVQAIRLQAELLKAAPDARTRKAGEVIGRNAERLQLLARDLLDLARADGGKLRIQAQTLDLASLIQDVIDSHSEQARRNDVDLRLAPTPLLSVEADRQRLAQVLANLVGNAIKFTPSGGVVEVFAEEREEMAVVEVRDTGMGFEPEEAERIFEPFYQVRNQAPRGERGTGLGLSVVKTILEAHGGWIVAESRGLDRGATFRFGLPLLRADGARGSAASFEGHWPAAAPYPQRTT